ncbi:MAG: hypothetical protein ACP5QG_02760 [candidate division WOR-3 bacterium]
MKRLSINVRGKAHTLLVDDADVVSAEETIVLIEEVIKEIEVDPKRPSQPDAVPVVACFRLAAELMKARAELRRIENIVKAWKAMEDQHGDL